MPASALEGSWHSGGYYGHDRSKTYNEQAQKYRRLAAPTLPQLFVQRSQQPISKHAFSEHDTRQSLSCGPIYFEHNIGRRRQSFLQPSDRRQRDFLTWIPDRKQEVKDVENNSVSSYTVDYRGVEMDIPRMNQRLVNHLRDSIEEEKRLPVSTYTHVHCSPYPQLLDVSNLPTTRGGTVTDRFHSSTMAPSNSNYLSTTEDNNLTTDRSLMTFRSAGRSKAATARDSVARCLVWYQPPTTKQMETTQKCEEKSQIWSGAEIKRTENLCHHEYCQPEENKINFNSSADIDVPQIVGL